MRRLVLFALLTGFVVACDTATTAPRLTSTAPQSDPISSASTLPSRVKINLPVDSVLTGDTLPISATPMDYSGKIQNQGKVSWTTHAIDSGTVRITLTNPKGQFVTLKGLTRGWLMIVASYTDRWGYTAYDSVMFHVAPRTATVGICTIPTSVADSLHFSGDTTADWGIIGQFCLPSSNAIPVNGKVQVRLL